MDKDIIEAVFQLWQVLRVPFVGLGFIGEKLVISIGTDDVTNDLMSCFTNGLYMGKSSIRLQEGEMFIVASITQRRVITAKAVAVHVERRYLNIREVSEYAGISVKTLYRWSREQKLPSRKVGHILRFDRAEIEGWLGRFKKGDTNADLLS